MSNKNYTIFVNWEDGDGSERGSSKYMIEEQHAQVLREYGCSTVNEGRGFLISNREYNLICNIPYSDD